MTNNYKLIISKLRNNEKIENEHNAYKILDDVMISLKNKNKKVIELINKDYSYCKTIKRSVSISKWNKTTLNELNFKLLFFALYGRGCDIDTIVCKNAVVNLYKNCQLHKLISETADMFSDDQKARQDLYVDKSGNADKEKLKKFTELSLYMENEIKIQFNEDPIEISESTINDHLAYNTETEEGFNLAVEFVNAYYLKTDTSCMLVNNTPVTPEKPQPKTLTPEEIRQTIENMSNSQPNPEGLLYKEKQDNDFFKSIKKINEQFTGNNNSITKYIEKTMNSSKRITNDTDIRSSYFGLLAFILEDLDINKKRAQMLSSVAALMSVEGNREGLKGDVDSFIKTIKNPNILLSLCTTYKSIDFYNNILKENTVITESMLEQFKKEYDLPFKTLYMFCFYLLGSGSIHDDYIEFEPSAIIEIMDLVPKYNQEKFQIMFNKIQKLLRTYKDKHSPADYYVSVIMTELILAGRSTSRLRSIYRAVDNIAINYTCTKDSLDIFLKTMYITVNRNIDDNDSFAVLTSANVNNMMNIICVNSLKKMVETPESVFELEGIIISMIISCYIDIDYSDLLRRALITEKPIEYTGDYSKEFIDNINDDLPKLLNIKKKYIDWLSKNIYETWKYYGNLNTSTKMNSSYTSYIQSVYQHPEIAVIEIMNLEKDFDDLSNQAKYVVANKINHKSQLKLKDEMFVPVFERICNFSSKGSSHESDYKLIKEMYEEKKTSYDELLTKYEHLTDETECKIDAAVKKVEAANRDEIAELKKKIKEQEKALKEKEQDSYELARLREIMFRQAAEEEEPNQIDKAEAEELIRKHRIIIVGGRIEKVSRLTQKYSNITSYDINGITKQNFAKCDIVFVFYKYLSHKVYYKANEIIKNLGIPYAYISKDSTKFIEQEMAESIKELL